MLKKSDRSKTLEQLDGDKWEKPEFQSHLVVTCHALRQKPIGNFSAEDLRIMIGQKFGLPWLMPLATELLKKNSFVEADFFRGDLLQNCIDAADAFDEYRAELLPICLHALKLLENTDDDVPASVVRRLCNFVRVHD